ncbi:MAG: hypothetical protein JJE10_05895 [Thermoleophilia bacterium]|nr:hypothetical protein [Thermoleophilia bacterium]
MPLALSTTVWLFGAAGFISLTAFVALILAPAMSSFGRWPEKMAAGFLSFFILGILITIGVVGGLGYVFVSQDVSGIFPWSGQ